MAWFVYFYFYRGREINLRKSQVSRDLAFDLLIQELVCQFFSPEATSFYVAVPRGTSGFLSATKKQLTASQAGSASSSLLRA